jgi:hypothetical protein
MFRMGSRRGRGLASETWDWSTTLVKMEWCAVRGAGQQRVQVPPGNWIAPPGSNRSGGRGNETAGAFDGKGSYSDSASVQAAT